MKQDFEKIKNWLKENAQKILNLSLQEPATESEINELDKTIGKSLPSDFKALYLWHNGLNDQKNFGSLFYGMDFFPVDRIIEEYLYKKEHYAAESIPLEKADEEIDPTNMYNNDWFKSGLQRGFSPLSSYFVKETSQTFDLLILKYPDLKLKVF